MTVLMTMWMQSDPKRFEELAAQDPDRVRKIADQAKEAGVLAHRFYGTEDGQMMVIDEWPDEQSFQSFFEAQQGEIGPLMQDAGVEGEPQIRFWRKLESHDEVGWGT
jgi:hypothetical protein